MLTSRPSSRTGAQAPGETSTPSGSVCGRSGELVAADAVRAVARPALAAGRATRLSTASPAVARAVVDELEVVEVEHASARGFVALGGGDRLRQLVLERALVGQVGQPVARRPGQRERWPPHERSPAEEVEERDAGDRPARSDLEQRPADVASCASRRVVVRDLVGVPAPDSSTGAMNSKSRRSRSGSASWPAEARLLRATFATRGSVSRVYDGAINVGRRR